MLGQISNSPLAFLYWLIALIVAITIHEFSHALVADRLGDPTPRLQGRLTLNPLAHLDPLGTIMLIIARFGWGKPVVFDPFNLRHPRRDAAFISLAGPASNLILASVCALVLRFLFSFHVPIASSYSALALVNYLVIGLLQPIIVLNVVLAVFNLVPIHPLDGFKIVGGILPEEYAHQWAELEPYGLIFLLFLILPLFGGISPISQLISPVINALLQILLPMSSII